MKNGTSGPRPRPPSQGGSINGESTVMAIESPPLVVWVSIILGMVATGCAAYVEGPWAWPVDNLRLLYLFVFRDIAVVRAVFIVSCAAHFLEGVWVWRIACRGNSSDAYKWFWQTVTLGYPSLRLLLGKKAQQMKDD